MGGTSFHLGFPPLFILAGFLPRGRADRMYHVSFRAKTKRLRSDLLEERNFRRGEREEEREPELDKVVAVCWGPGG